MNTEDLLPETQEYARMFKGQSRSTLAHTGLKVLAQSIEKMADKPYPWQFAKRKEYDRLQRHYNELLELIERAIEEAPEEEPRRASPETEAGWDDPVTGEVSILDQSGTRLHTWHDVRMQCKVRGDECIVRLLDDISWDVPKEVQVHDLAIWHPEIPTPVYADLPVRPLVVPVDSSVNFLSSTWPPPAP